VSEGASANPALRLSSTVGVRHEVVQVAVGTATSSVLTAMLQDSTRRSAAGILPRRASSGKPSPWGALAGCEALRTKVSLILRDGNEIERERCDC